jgi:hypothetical protein
MAHFGDVHDRKRVPSPARFPQYAEIPQNSGLAAILTRVVSRSGNGPVIAFGAGAKFESP